MLSLAVIRNHLKRLTYRPGWQFDVYLGRYEGLHISIQAKLPDSVYIGQMVDVRIDSSLPPLDTLEQFEFWLLWRLNIIESHECREWLKRDGLPIADPHAPNAQHDW